MLAPQRADRRAALTIFAIAVAGAMSPAAQAAPAKMATPAGIGSRLTLEGPVFVDGRGMTLYTGAGPCTGDRRTRVRPIQAEGDVPFDVVVERPRSCLEKNPPVLAVTGARAIGKWTLIPRADGTRQWAYEGKPLHTSLKDRAPGEINGSYLVRLGRGGGNAAVAPLQGVPAGIRVRETAAGLTYVDHTGRALYVPTRRGAASGLCDRACAKSWRPLFAPALAGITGLAPEWSLVDGPGGRRQWAHRGGPLYTYAHDTPANGEQVFGDTYGGTWAKPIPGWRVAVALAAPRRPDGVTVQSLPGDTEIFSFGLPKTVYADANGRTLYTLHCVEAGDDEETGGLACDDIGDDPRYWLSFCGGEARCARTWRPLLAPASARALDAVWSPIVINPRHPFRPAAKGQALRVWAYRGRPVFTYAQDQLPGDFYGDDHGFGTTGTGQLQARPIPAHAHGPARRPAVTLTALRGG